MGYEVEGRWHLNQGEWACNLSTQEKEESQLRVPSNRRWIPCLTENKHRKKPRLHLLINRLDEFSKSNQPFKKSNKGPMQFEKSQTSSPTELQTFIKRLRNTWQEDPCGNESKRSKSTWPGFMAFLTAKAPGVRKGIIRIYSTSIHFTPLSEIVLWWADWSDWSDWAGHGPGLQRLWEEVSRARPSAGLGGPVLAPGTPATKFTRTPQLKQNTYRIY